MEVYLYALPDPPTMWHRFYFRSRNTDGQQAACITKPS